MTALVSLQEGIVALSYNADTTAAGASNFGIEFAVPQGQLDRHRTITWQYTFAADPVSCNIRLQGSIDGTNWFDLDTGTTTTGEMRKITDTLVRFLRGFKQAQGNTQALTLRILI